MGGYSTWKGKYVFWVSGWTVSHCDHVVEKNFLLFFFFFLSEKPEMSVPEFYLVHFKWKEQTCFEDQMPRVRAPRRRALKTHDLEWRWLDSSAAPGLFHRRGIVDAKTVEKKNKTAFKTGSHVRLRPCTAAEMEPHCTVCHCPSRLQVTSPVHWLCVAGTQMASSLTVCHLLDLLRTSRWDDFAKRSFFYSRVAHRKTPDPSPSGP